MVRRLILFILMLFASVLHVAAHCCSAGNPYFYSEQANMGHEELQLTTGYKYSTSNTYYTGSE